MKGPSLFRSIVTASCLLQGCLSFSPSHLSSKNRMFQVSRFASSGSVAIIRQLPNRSYPPTSILRLATNGRKAGKRTKRKQLQGVFRADRVLSNRGWGSRSECFEILKNRRVFQKIDSKMKRILGPKEKIAMDVSLWIDGKIEVPQPPPLLRVYHKPKWVLSVMKDEKGRKNLGDLDFISKMHPVGRLDYDTSGLILFSSNGGLTQTLLHPTHEIQKEYVAVVVGKVDEDELRRKLAEGVTTSIGSFPADLVATKPLPKEQVKPFVANILENLPPEYDPSRLEEKGYLFFKDAEELSEVRLVVEEGKHRMIRRILANSGFPVISLKRERLGEIRLGDLDEGSYRDLSDKEEQWINAILKNAQHR